jgi:hypothetical protein
MFDKKRKSEKISASLFSARFIGASRIFVLSVVGAVNEGKNVWNFTCDDL